MVCNSVGIMHFKFLEFNLEDLIGRETGVLESFEERSGYSVHIGQDLLEGAAAVVGDVMLLVGKPPNEVIHSDVVWIFDDVMDDALVGFTIGIEIDRARFIGVSGSHETVGGYMVVIAHVRMYTSAFPCRFDILHGRAKQRLLL